MQEGFEYKVFDWSDIEAVKAAHNLPVGENNNTWKNSCDCGLIQFFQKKNKLKCVNMYDDSGDTGWEKQVWFHPCHISWIELSCYMCNNNSSSESKVTKTLEIERDL